MDGMVTVIIGAGQAGLAVSRELGLRGVEHVLLEAEAVASAWRNRWDSFTLVTPNWTLDLPGQPYDGPDPEGHVSRDEIVAYLEKYAASYAGPIRTGVRVDRLSGALSPGSPGSPGSTARFRLETSDGPIDTDTVVVCSGAFPKPHRPALAGAFPDHVAVLDAQAYRNPRDLPDGPVLVVGSGQTGIQLAEDLHLDGREVTVACGRAPWIPRRLDGLDTVTWVNRTSFLDQRRSQLPSPARLVANFQATGRDGGHDLHYRVLQTMGVRLTGRIRDVTATHVEFAGDLAQSVAFGDDRYADLRNLMRDELGSDAPEMPDPEPFVCDPPDRLDLSGLAAVLFTSGYRPDYASWVDFPIFDDLGFPVVDEALRTAVPGLFFCGVHVLRTRRSALLFGVGQDAAIVAESLSEDLTRLVE